jgi:hypothetical protein
MSKQLVWWVVTLRVERGKQGDHLSHLLFNLAAKRLYQSGLRLACFISTFFCSTFISEVRINMSYKSPHNTFLFSQNKYVIQTSQRSAERSRLIKGLVPEYVTNGIAILHYADDTIVWLQDDEENARYMKLLLYLYEQMPGLKIKFEKSEDSWFYKMNRNL